MAAPPFKVKATYDYASPHEDDLGFPSGQIITVTEVEDADWYIGEYTDPSGDLKSGLFPQNFVERYEPAAPPRPVRSTRPKTEKLPEPESREAEQQVEPESISQAPVEAETEPEPTPKPVPKAVPKPIEAQPAQPAPAPTPSAAKSPPPPVAEKPSSFRDRIAAFNKPAAPPVTPFKPSALGSTGFIKKPFVAPPPSRNAYVPPPKEQVTTKVYRREEDPEIAERQAQDLEDASKAGLVPAGQEEQEEDTPKPVSLKERIALLQKQQMEQAARRTEPVKEKPKRPPKKRTESHEQEGNGDDQDIQKGETVHPDSSDLDREPMESATRKQPKVPKPVAPVFSDGNEADQSAADETAEEAEGASTGVDEDDETLEPRQRQAPTATEEEAGEDESTEEEEMDEEARSQIALRERMAKLSGGYGMPGMFGPPGGLPMMGMGAAPKKKKPEKKSESYEERSPPPPAPRVPGLPMPGLTRSQTGDSDTSGPTPTERGQSIDEAFGSSPPIPPAHATNPGSVGVAPPIPGGRPHEASSSRAPPPLRPNEPIRSPSPGSESDDEMPGGAMAQDPNPPLSPGSASRPFANIASVDDSAASLDSLSTRSPAEKRLSRAPPPIPVTSPTQPRAPPPIPGDVPRNQIPRTGADGESEYEGDYDTDIGSTVKHKDALKSHAREPSLDDSTMTDDASIRSPPPIPIIPPASRPVPPPPPSLPPARPSLDTSRPVPPPPVPPRGPGDEDYDPFNYSSPQMPRSPSTPTIPNTSAPPVPGLPPPPPVPPRALDDEDDSDDDLYASPKRPADRPPPPPPPPSAAPPVERSAPPPPALEPSSPRAVRQSNETERQLPVRRSTDQNRPSFDQGSMARDVDLAKASKWWTLDNTPPPIFQNKPDLYFEIEESQTKQRGGKTTVSKDVYILYHDYSQSVISARFDSKATDDVILEQRHEVPPHKLRQDQLEEFWNRFGSKITEALTSKQNTTVGDGSPQSLISELLAPLKGALAPVGSRSFGALVYANLANASVQQFDEIRPGDIVSFRNAKFQGKHGTMHQKYHTEAGKPDHVGIVVEWDGTKKKIRAAEQGRESKKCKVESFRLGDLRSGEVRVWRVVSREWVGWGDE